ncbi:MAG: fibrobacter succinogenes major paralogous domain-containing protein [Bacteroidales bacterium]|nr:fibrobacter succinogenes major paralogous domain-containing protein [Bacteroidales bacterium]
MKQRIFFNTAILTILLNLVISFAEAQIPRLINYQARLVNPATNLPVADGTYNLVFAIYETTEGGIPIWSETQSVQITNGIYSLLLGSLNPLDLSLFEGSPRYLGVAVGAEPEMVPRKQMVSVPYALHSQTAESLTGIITDTTIWKRNLDDIYYIQGKVGIGTSAPDPSAALDISSTSKGFLSPRMTQLQRDFIAPVEGLMIYNLTTKKPNFYNGEEWMNYDGTSAASPPTDADGNIYNTVVIGTQTWLVENLKSTKYRNGDIIGTTTPAIMDISSESTPKYQWPYDGNEDNVAVYGRLYTWYAITDSRNVCPSGWHVPNDIEWSVLAEFLGGASVAGGKLKETGTSHWNPPNTGASNESGFTALPGGGRYSSAFGYMGGYGHYMSSDEVDADNAGGRIFAYDNGILDNYGSQKSSGFSVRCIKDAE